MILVTSTSINFYEVNYYSESKPCYYKPLSAGDVVVSFIFISETADLQVVSDGVYAQTYAPYNLNR